MVATHIKRIKHSVRCVTGVYLGDITRSVFVILYLNVCRLRVCSSCFYYLFIYSVSFVDHQHISLDLVDRSLSVYDFIYHFLVQFIILPHHSKGIHATHSLQYRHVCIKYMPCDVLHHA